MTKWLPTLAPIALIIATALSTTMQSHIASATAAHPWLAVVVTSVLWIVNHWLTPPNAAPAK
jgi:hypothetical protein